TADYWTVVPGSIVVDRSLWIPLPPREGILTLEASILEIPESVIASGEHCGARGVRRLDMAAKPIGVEVVSAGTSPRKLLGESLVDAGPMVRKPGLRRRKDGKDVVGVVEIPGRACARSLRCPSTDRVVRKTSQFRAALNRPCEQ